MGAMSQPGFENPQRTPLGTSAAPVPVKTDRQWIVQFAHWACAHEPQIHYAEIRPIPHVTPHVLPHLPFTTDCSGFSTMAYQYAGAPDPNGNHYDGQGYTGSLLQHAHATGAVVPIGKVRPGDLVVYGCKSNPNGHHVAIVTAVAAKTFAGIQTASHGQEKGPFAITVAVEAQYQPDGTAGVRFLSFLP